MGGPRLMCEYLVCHTHGFVDENYRGVFLEFGLVSHVVLRTISRFCKVWLM